MEARKPETAKDRLGAWVGRGSWALTEQVLFAATNFAINLALARSLPAESYGAFGMCLATLLLLSSAQDALLSEPALMLGAGKYRGAFASYMAAVVGWQWFASAVSGGILILFGLGASVICSYTVSLTYLAAGVAAPGFLYMALARGACYARQQPRTAAVGGLFNLLAMFAGAGALEHLGVLSAPTAFLLVGGAGLIAGATMLRWLGVSVVGERNALPGAPVPRDHWGYGKWILASSVANWATGNLYLVLVPAVAGLAAGGAWAALTLFVRPVLTMLTPVVLLMVPMLVQHRDRPDFARFVLLPMMWLVGGCSMYWAGLAVAHEPLVAIVFGGKYLEYSSALIIIGAVPVVMSGARILVSALRAISRPDAEFRATLASAGVSVTAGVALVVLFGLWGAAMGLVLSSLVLAVRAALILSRLRGFHRP